MANYDLNSITHGNDTYNLKDNSKIPLSGTTALSGSIVPDTDNAYDLGNSSHNYKIVYAKEIRHGLSSGSLVLSGGNGTTNGANLVLYGTNRSDGFQGRFELVAKGSSVYKLIGFSNGVLAWNGFYIHPLADNVCCLGVNNNRWKEIWCTQSSLNSSSDKRLKQQIDSIDDKLLDAWENVQPTQYKFNDAVETKGKSARYHLGYVSQDVQSVLEKSGVDAGEYGFFLYDSWDEQEEVSHEETYTDEVQTKDGKTETVTKTRKVIDTPYRAEGDSYGLRYTECLVVECAYLRRENNRLKERLSKIEKLLNI